MPILADGKGRTFADPHRVPLGPSPRERKPVPGDKVPEAIAAAWGIPTKHAEAIASAAYELGANPGSLANLIGFESGGTFDPSVTNHIGATGLIQFTPRTASRMGMSTDQLKAMTFERQMREVKRYLQMTADGEHWDSPGVSGGYDSEQALLMAVFFPPYRFVAPDTKFPQWAIDANTYTLPSGRTVAIDTPGTYTERMQSFARSRADWNGATARYAGMV